MSISHQERERQRAATVMQEGRQRSAARDQSFAAHRQMAARHALNVLTADHRAFMAAIGKGDVTLDVAFTESQAAEAQGGSQQPFWRSVNKAYTNFAKILVRVPMPALRTPLREFVIGVRGTLHHETGHVRFTIPLPELWDRAMASGQVAPRPDLSVSKLQLAWNCLEDQRMEAAVVRATPRIATYFTPMVLSYVLADTQAQGYMSGHQKQAVDAMGPWLAVAGRDYLPDVIRARARDEFDQFAQQYDLASDDWFHIVARYMGATDEADMMQALFEAHDFLAKLLDQVAGDQDSGTQHLQVMSMMQTKEALAKKVTNTNEQHQQMTDSDGNDPEHSASHPQQPQYSGDGASATDEVEQVLASAEVDDVLARINERIGSGVLPVEHDEHAFPMPESLVAGARALAHDIRDALEVFRTERSAVWVRHQEHGYLDPLAYRTREPGDRAYHRQPQHWDTNGLGLHVSLLADRSGSMASDMDVLSQTLWAVKTACDALDLPSTMVLWAESHQTVRVMEHDTTPLVYSARGGTDPLMALNDLDTHVTQEGLHHLVFVFTDGDWATMSSLTEWRHPDRTFVIVGLHCEATIANKDADLVIPITSIHHLGAVVKHVLADYVDMA